MNFKSLVIINAVKVKCYFVKENQVSDKDTNFAKKNVT